MSRNQGLIRVANNANMANAYTLPYAKNVSFQVSAWNSKAIRRERSMRIEHLGDVYTLKFRLPITANDSIYKEIKRRTVGMVFYVEFYNTELGIRQTKRFYRTDIIYNYIGEGRDLYEEVEFTWIGMDTQ